MTTGVLVDGPIAHGLARATLAAMRPRQWTKNLLLFAGILFAAELGDAGALARRDRGVRRLLRRLERRLSRQRRARRRRRPPPSGQAPSSRRARRALAPHDRALAAATLAAAALALATRLGLGVPRLPRRLRRAAGAYTLGLKHVVLVDVIAISGLFVLRAAAGARRGRRADLALAPALHRPAGALPRPRQAPRRARARRRRPRRPGDPCSPATRCSSSTS